MQNAFHSDDGGFYQSAMRLHGTPVIRMTVEKLVIKRSRVSWEWTVWAVPGEWREPDIDWHGTAPSLLAAELAAMDAGIAMVASLTRREVHASRDPMVFNMAYAPTMNQYGGRLLM